MFVKVWVDENSHSVVVGINLLKLFILKNSLNICSDWNGFISYDKTTQWGTVQQFFKSDDSICPDIKWSLRYLILKIELQNKNFNMVSFSFLKRKELQYIHIFLNAYEWKEAQAWGLGGIGAGVKIGYFINIHKQLHLSP